VEAGGKVFVSTELRGGGTTTPETVALAERGVDNLLRFAGILPGDPEVVASQALEIPGSEYYRVSEHRGLLEFAVALGDAVRAGDVLARVHSLERTGEAPVEYYAPCDGLLIGRRHPALVNVGDTFAVLAVPR
jgi:N-alpha-acetyl-L-2,4-diaminobutyrate deacetylase